MTSPGRQEREKPQEKKDARVVLREEDRPAVERVAGSLKTGGVSLPPEPPADRHRLLLERLEAPGRAGEKAALLHGIHQTYGNRYVQRLLGASTRGGENSRGPRPVVLPEGGRPLDKPAQEEMQSRFGESFSGVRIHTDSAAANAAQALGARALTAGQDIYFGRGAYQPGSEKGKGLLAHELTHTLQQRGSRPGTQHALEVAPPDDPLEREAERAAGAVVGGRGPGSASVPGGPALSRTRGLRVQRSPDGAPPAPTATGSDASGYFVIGLGGLKLKQEEISRAKSKGVFRKDISSMSLPGLKLKTLTLDLVRATGEIKGGRVAADLDVSYLKLPGRRGPQIEIDKDGKASFDAKGRLDIPALNSPELSLSLKEGEVSAALTLTAEKLKPAGIPKLKVPRAGVTVGLGKGKLHGDGQVSLEYPGLAKGDFNVGFKDGAPSGKGKVELTPDYLRGTEATLEIAEGQLKGALTLPASKLAPPIPGLKITDGTVSLGMENSKLSGKGENIAFAYQSLGEGTLNFTVMRDHLEGSGSLTLSIPGLTPVKGDIRYAGGNLSGKATITPNKFPKGLPVKSGSITVLLDEKGDVGGKGAVAIDLLGVGRGELKLGYEKGVTDLSAEVELLKIPGLETGRILIGVKDGKLGGEGEIGIAPKQVPGLTGNLLVAYKDDRFSGKTKLGYTKDKFAGEVEIVLNQDEKGKMLISGSGDVTARLTDWLTGKVHIDVLPDATTRIAGQLKADDVQLFPEKKADRELFSISQNIPLWAILVAVIRLRGGVRAGVGPGRLRGITAEGQFSTVEGEAPSFSVTGELFIPAYAEAYVAFGAGLGLDVVIGSLTGGIEAVGTAGIYGAVSVIPEIAYEGGNFSISGTATLAAGAKLKLGLQAWAEVEALWITVWSNEWKLAEWMWDVGPELAMQAQMKYVFGRPEPPTFEFKTSDIDSKSLIRDAMPKDGPKGSGAREALQNRAEWKGRLKEQRKDPNKIPAELAAKQAKAPVPKSLPAKPPKKAPPAGLKVKDPAKVRDEAAKGLKEKAGPGKGKELDKAHQEKWNKGMAALEKLAAKSKTDAEDPREIKQHLAEIKSTFGFTRLDHRLEGEEWLVEAGMSPSKGVKVQAAKADLPTEVRYDPPDPVRGARKMVAHPLTYKHETGSAPSGAGAPPIWEDVNQRRNNRRLYVLGHLLNQHLGGPGDTTKNLTPITFSANSSHSWAAERDLRTAVNKNKEMVHYEVEVNYPTGREPVPDYFTPPKGHPAEGDLARSLTVQWWKLKGSTPSDLKQDGPVKGPFTIKNVPPFPQT